MRRMIESSLGKMPTTMKGQQAFHPISEGDAVSRPRRGASLHLLVQALQRIGRMDPGPVLAGEVQVCQHVGLAVVDECPELGTLFPELIGPRS